MIALKKLVFAIDKALKLKADNVDREELQKLTDDALTYLKKAKTFEYAGDIKLSGAVFKLVDLNMDFDDIVKELIDKRTDIRFKGELSLIIEEVIQDASKIVA